MSEQESEVPCKRCSQPVKAAAGTIITCWQCMMELTEDSVPKSVKKSVGYPRGWKFMKEFVHANGTVYFKGVEQPKLKGTKKATPIKKPKKVTDTRSKARREEDRLANLAEISKLKKQLKTAKTATKRKKIQAQIKKLL